MSCQLGVVVPGGLATLTPGQQVILPLTEPNNNNDKPLIIKVLPSQISAYGGKGKRRPSGPIVTTSDEEESPDSPRAQSVELTDHDYENVSSPGNSSTASGPTYVRQPGFIQHAHEVTAPPPGVSKPRIKKKKTGMLGMKDGLRRRDPTPPKNKPKRDPLPMRMRALPQSFWQQPNVAHNVSPGTAYPILPPLYAREGEELSEIRPITPPPEDKPATDKDKPHKPHRPVVERKLTIANTDLLFKLFEGVEKETKKPSNTASSSSSSSHKDHGHKKASRTRKVVPVTTNKTMVTGEDPYLVDCVSDKLFPELRLEQTKGSQHGTHACVGSILQVVTLKEGDKSISLPSLASDTNYSQMLSELVAHF